jgi:hypothetical protein
MTPEKAGSPDDPTSGFCLGAGKCKSGIEPLVLLGKNAQFLPLELFKHAPVMWGAVKAGL